MKKMVLGIIAFICALPAFAMDKEGEESAKLLHEQMSFLKNLKENIDFEGVTFEKIPEDGPRKGTLYLQEAGSQLKCTGLITICENQVEKSYPISVLLFAPQGLTAESLKSIHLDHSSQIQSLFKHALETLQEKALRERIDQGKISPEPPSHQEEVFSKAPSQEPTRAGWWSAGASLLTPSSWLSYSNPGVDPKEINHEEEQRENLSPPEQTPTQRSWGLGSWSGLLARSSEGEKETVKPEIFPGKAHPTTLSLPDFPPASMSVDEIPFSTSASSTDPLSTTEPSKGMWRSVEEHLNYLNLGGYLEEKKRRGHDPIQRTRGRDRRGP
jgi:hypothetical protein